jgi:predicted DNA-binding protein YlxM (UPF0122 family)
MKGFIYGIFSKTLNSYIYIGKHFNMENIHIRRNSHLHYLRNGYHYSEKLQLFFNSFGEKDFDFKVVKKYSNITDDQLYQKEEYYINFYNTYNSENGCNQTRGGKGVSMPMSEETKAKVSESKKIGYLQGKYQPTVGEINGMNVLKEDQIKEIIRLLKTKKYSHHEIAELFNVSRQIVSYISTGKRWGYLQEVNDYVKENSPRKYRKPLTKTEIYEIKFLTSKGKFTNKEVSLLYEIHPDTVRKIKTGVKFNEIDITQDYKFYKEVN